MKPNTPPAPDLTSPSGVQQPAPLLSRDGVVCSVLFLLCVIAIWPVAAIGINDDWSYILTTRALFHTHHFVFSGWASPMLGWQALWGSVFAWMFGTSFTAIRLSMIPIAVGTILVYHAILQSFSLNRAHAVFGTLTMVLSPLVLPLSATFMSDLPGLFVVLLCIYLCQRALSASSDKHAVLWLVAAGLTNIVGGTVRQIAWLGVLVIVPSCGWLLRRRRGVAFATLATWAAGVVSIKLLIDWFLRHPYSINERLFSGTIGAGALVHLVITFAKLVPVTLLLILPVLVAGAAGAWPLRRKEILGAVLAFASVCGIYLLSKRMGQPALIDTFWPGNITTPFGIMQGPELFASAHRLPVRWMALIFALLAVFTFLFIRGITRASTAGTPRPRYSRSQWKAMNTLLLPFLLAYILLLSPRAAFVVLFDRYLLEIIPVLLVYLLLWHQERVEPSIPAIGVAALVGMAILSTAATHDLFSRARAEVRLTNRILQAGIPRTEIRGGFDFDTVTEVQTAGYLNDPHLENPPGAFHPMLTDESGPCGDPFLVYLPAMHVKYVVTPVMTPCLRPSGFAPEVYRNWLPPAKRELFVGIKLAAATPAP